MGARNWFAFDGNDWDRFETEAEAVEWAEAALSHYRDEAPEGWAEEVEQIFVAKITTVITVTERRSKQDGDCVHSSIDEIVDYALVGAQEGEHGQEAE